MNRELKKQIAKAFDAPTPGRKVQFIHSLPRPHISTKTFICSQIPVSYTHLSNRQCDDKEINTAELQKQSRQLTSEKMKLYDDYKDGRIDRDSYKQRAGKISVQLEEIKRKIEDAENSKKLLEQNELSDKIKLKDFLGIQKFDTEKLREIIKVIRVHSQDEIEIEWNFDDIFSE